MRRSLMSLTVAAAVGVGSFVGGTNLKAEAASASISSLKKQQGEIQSKQADLNSTIKDADQKIDSLRGQQVDVQTELKRIGLAIDSTNKDIQEKTSKLEETKVQINKLQDDIKVIQDRIQKRNELLKDRARNYQENGSVSYVNVLMGAQSFSDLIDLAGAVATIMEADQAILKQAEADKLELEKKQTQLETQRANQQQMVNDLKSLNNKLTSQKTEQSNLLASLQQQEKEATDDKMSMQEQAQILASQQSAIQQAIKQEQDRQAAAAAAAQAAAAKAAAAAKSAASTPAKTAPSSGGSSAAVAAPPVSSGSFTRPASGVVSSTYGPRWGTFHYGVDIANSGPNVPIVAAADGVVVTAHFSTSYGNVVYISHSINGHVYTTVYAHMSRYLVSTGQSVSKGQQIGVMGSTGEATGQHLHFELYNGPWAYHSAINPMGIVPF